MSPTPKSLILDLLATIGDHSMPVRALVAAGEVFSIRPESLRVALARLLEQGTIERDGRGQYRIARAARAVKQHVVSWNRIEERVTIWRGGWIGVHVASLLRSDRVRLRKRERALRFLGLRELDSGLWLRPDNLAGGIEAVRRELIDLGLDDNAPVFAITKFDESWEARARGLWDAETLRRGYREARARLEKSAARLPQLGDREAMVESFVLGGDVLRTLAVDPLLPEPIVPAGERAALVETMQEYDRLGRDRWKPFMREQGAPHPRTPLHPRALRGPLESSPSHRGA